MKKFRIRKISDNPNAFQYKVDQRHSILGLFYYWDNGAYDLCPHVLYNTKEDALKAIAELVTDTNLLK